MSPFLHNAGGWCVCVGGGMVVNWVSVVVCSAGSQHVINKDNINKLSR